MSSKISALSAASIAALSNEFAINEAGTSKKVSGTQLKALLGPIDIVGSKRDFGCIGNNVADDTANLLEFFADTSNAIKFLEIGSYLFDSPALLSAAGSHYIGADGGGAFAAILRPMNCRAFEIDGVHQSLLQNMTIWPQGTSPPDATLYFNDSYSIRFEHMRVHQASATAHCPTEAVIVADGICADMIFNDVIIRNDGGDPYPCIAHFNNGCGLYTFDNCDFEVAMVGFDWEGGRINVSNLYSEALAIGLKARPASDSTPSFCFTGGYLQATTSGIPIAIYDGCKNLRLGGVYLDRIAASYDVYIYGLSGSSNIVLDYINIDQTAWASQYSPVDPDVIQFCAPNNGVAVTAPTYSTSITPSVPLGTRISTARITATNSTGFTVNVPASIAPSGPTGQDGTQLTVMIRNSSGGALGTATFAAGYKFGASWTQPANGFSRSITFVHNLTNWVEVSRSAVDVAN